MKVLFAITVLMLAFPAVLRAEIGRELSSSIYSPVGKRDPFRPPAEELGRDVSSVNPLEKYSIDKFQLKAILKGIGRARAMFEDPDGKSFILSEGDTVGRERGTISRIENTDVIITERTFNYLGAENLYERVLSLPPDSSLNEVDGGSRASVSQVRSASSSSASLPRQAAPVARPAERAAPPAPIQNSGNVIIQGGNVK